MVFDIPYNEPILYFIFYASVIGYNFVKYFGVARFHNRQLIFRLKWIQVLSFVCFCLMIYYAFQLQLKTFIWIAVFGLATFFYAIPFLPKRLFVDNRHNFRSIKGLKIYVIALTWVGVTVFLPLINSEYSISADVVIVALQRFVFVIILMLPFEIRDLKFDSLKLGTIPQKIGIKKTKLLGVLMLVLMFCLEYFKDEIVVKQIIVLSIMIAITFLFLVFSKKEQGKYYSAFWVESLPIFWLLLLLLLT